MESSPEPEVIDWSDENRRHTWLAHALIMLISENEEVSNRYWKTRNEPPEKGKMVVECKVDGVDVSLRHVLDRLGQEFDHQVELAAKKKLREKFGKIGDFLRRLESSMRAEFSELDLDE